MLQLTQISANCAVVRNVKGIAVLFSYSTAVAVEHPKRGLLRTNQFYSKTTSRHINAWIGGRSFKIVPQAEIDKLA